MQLCEFETFFFLKLGNVGHAFGDRHRYGGVLDENATYRTVRYS
jgi:hypothetical protein